MSFYAKASEVKRAFYSKQPILVLLYKEANFSINDLNQSLPSATVSLLHEFEDVFLEEILDWVPTNSGI